MGSKTATMLEEHNQLMVKTKNIILGNVQSEILWGCRRDQKDRSSSAVENQRESVTRQGSNQLTAFVYWGSGASLRRNYILLTLYRDGGNGVTSERSKLRLNLGKREWYLSSIS